MPRSKWSVFAVVAVGVFMATLDSSIVNISLPVIARAFHEPVGGAVEWVVIAYLVVVASLLLTAGRLADMFGERPLWMWGLAIFTAGSLACGASTSLPMLVGARGLQGVGGTLLMAISPAMLTRAFPPTERGRVLGLNALVVAAGVSAGPTLGGVIAEHLSWRWIFFVNLPVGVVGIVATWLVLAREPGRRQHRFDPAGALLIAVALGAFTGGLSFAGELAASGWVLKTGLAVGAAAVVALLFVERKVKQPVLDLALFRSRVFASASASLVLAFLALFAVSFLLPFYLEQLRHFPPEKAGLLMTPMPVTIALVSPLSGWISDRIGTRPLAAGGMAVSCLGLWWLASLDEATSLTGIVLRLCVVGLGTALFQPPNNSAIMGAAPGDRQGIAAGVLATGRVVGQSLSVALAGAVFGALGGRAASAALEHGARDLATAHRFLHGFRDALLVCAAVAAVGIVASLVRGRDRPAASGSSDVARA